MFLIQKLSVVNPYFNQYKYAKNNTTKHEKQNKCLRERMKTNGKLETLVGLLSINSYRSFSKLLYFNVLQIYWNLHRTYKKVGKIFQTKYKGDKN